MSGQLIDCISIKDTDLLSKQPLNEVKSPGRSPDPLFFEANIF